MQPHVVHVSVDNVSKGIWPSDSGWFIFSACAAAAAALATAFLAVLTWSLASATTTMAGQAKRQVDTAFDAFKQAERHHQQSLMPVVFLEATCKAETSSDGHHVVFEGDLVNVGPGASTEVIAYVLCGTYEGNPMQEFAEQKVYLGLVGPN